MIRRPRRSTLFPYTRFSDLTAAMLTIAGYSSLLPAYEGAGRCRVLPPLPHRGRGARESSRSEEHTSELQSPDHLVCVLLLEKKQRPPTNEPPIAVDVGR